MYRQPPVSRKNALRNLRQLTDIIIKPADKGSTVVVLSEEHYIKEADQQLNDQRYYQKLDVDPTPRYSPEIKSFINSMFTRGQIDKKKLKSTWFLTTRGQRDSTFYLKFISLAILVDRLCLQMVSRQKTSHILWIVFCNHSRLLFQPTSGTPLTLSTGSEGYHYYL